MIVDTAYIAGPMSGYRLHNFPAFDECRDALDCLGYKVSSPADMDREVGFDPATGKADKAFLDAAMKRDVEAIMQVDFMVMLPDWRESTGATAEYHLAKWRHIPVFEWPSMRLVDELKSVAETTQQAHEKLISDTFKGYVEGGESNTLRFPLDAMRGDIYVDTAGGDWSFRNGTWHKNWAVNNEPAEIGGIKVKWTEGLPDGNVVGSYERVCKAQQEALAGLGDYSGNSDPKAEAASEKCPMHLLPPAALAQTAWVHGLGAAKYGDYNWRYTGIKFDTYVGAIMRHLMLAHGGEWIDTESGLPHIAHIAASCNILLDADHHDKLEKYE